MTVGGITTCTPTRFSRNSRFHLPFFSPQVLLGPHVGSGPEEIGWAVRSAYSKQIAVSELPPPLVEILNKEIVVENDIEKSIDNIISIMKYWGKHRSQR
jgi:hypothetical protein